MLPCKISNASAQQCLAVRKAEAAGQLGPSEDRLVEHSGIMSLTWGTGLLSSHRLVEVNIIIAYYNW